jgi:hypothetical protein
VGYDTHTLTRSETKKIVDAFYREILQKESPMLILMPSIEQAYAATVLLQSFIFVWNQVESQVWNQVESQVLDQVLDQVWNQVGNQVWNQVGNQVWNQVLDQVWNQVRNQVGNQVESQVGNQIIVFPYYVGSFNSYIFAFYDFFRTELKMDFGKKYDIWRNTTKLGVMYCCDSFCVVSAKPVEVYRNSHGLHKDGRPALKYSDGFCFWALNGTIVPQWLAETPSGQIDPARISEISNAQVRAEFVKKVGLERIYHVLRGKTIDTLSVSLKTSCEENWVCEYKLIEMKYDNNTQRRVLVMPNATLHDVQHVEYVPTTCNTVNDAMNFRLNREEKDVKETGDKWWLHGDVIIRPKNAKTWTRWPEVIA